MNFNYGWILWDPDPDRIIEPDDDPREDEPQDKLKKELEFYNRFDDNLNHDKLT